MCLRLDLLTVSPLGFYELCWTLNEIAVSESLQIYSNWGDGPLL